MRERANALSREFTRYLRAFDAAAKFSGPSLYFHLQTIRIRRECREIPDLLESELFFEYLYATLASWGMHRMGRGNTKLRDLAEIKESVCAQSGSLEKLQRIRLSSLTSAEFQRIIPLTWRVLGSLSISIAQARLVANSKVLHHILPDLVPPIDRTYTFNFFYNRNMLTVSEEEAFTEMMVHFHSIASANAHVLQSMIGPGWYTSETKILDNALVGYVVEELRVEED